MLNIQGLSEKEALTRLKKYGTNELTKKKKISPISIFIGQFKNFMTIVLIAAAVVSFLLGEKADSITIMLIIIINSILGFIQEYKAEKSIEALKQLSAPAAKVLREGKITHISAKYIVPDDIIIIESGDRIPCDCKVIECHSLMIDESLLTGESVAVEKNILSESRAYMGTVAISGRGKLLTLSTGMNTEMGKIAHMLQEIEEDSTPLQKKLEQLGQVLVIGCLLICALVSITGILRGEDPYRMLLIGISLAVAAIPEGLPAIVTIALALGVQRMYKCNALIRRLPAVETLGCTSVICSDKTGTLTLNKMTVKEIFAQDHSYEIGDTISSNTKPYLALCLEASSACNNSEYSSSKKNGILGKIVKSISSKEEELFNGDPTEVAILAAAAKSNIWKENIDQKYKRVHEIPFDSTRKRMSVVCKDKSGDYYVFVKGAVDTIINLCNQFESKSGVQALTSRNQTEILNKNEQMAMRALRVIGVAYKKMSSFTKSEEILEGNLCFIGMLGMIDPPRSEAKSAIETCKIAGIKPVMITGDHALTASAIAKELGLMQANDLVVTGETLEKMSDKELEKSCEKISVYARVSPKHKLRIVKALKKNNHVVAMTGDGVNDAPAIKEADIGIAMGINGTDVAKEASSMILLDDNFSTIVAAIGEGRIIYDNIRKFIRYLLSCNIGEVLTMFLASLFGLPVPLIPLQILWINLATDGLPAMALGIDPPDKMAMFRQPRGKDESIFSKGLTSKIIIRGIVIGFGTLCVYSLMLYLTYDDIVKARTCAFASLVLSQLFFVFECRSETKSIFQINPLTNLYLLAAVLCSLALLLIVIYIPFLQLIFETVALSAIEWIIIVFMSMIWTLISSIGMRLSRRM